MGTEAANQFTAAQIAAALGKAPQAVRRVLADVEVAGERMVRGNRTATWKIESLPESLQAELNTAAQARGLETIAALFLEAEPWQPKIPWRDVCPEQQAEALKLQRALLPILERHHSPILDNGELVQIGLRNYAREFAKQISPERFQYLFNRTVERDRNAEQFHRIELFLPGNLKAARAPRQSSAADAAFEPLHDCIARFNDPLKPTIDEVDALWQAAVELFTESSGDEPKKFKRRLLDYLWQRASFLAASWNALRVNLDRKVKLVRESKAGALALLDGRHLKCGETKAPAVPQDDVDRIAWHSARNCGGRTAQAVRELASMGDRSGLTKDTLDLITAPHANKSHVNRRLFVTVKRESDLIAPFLLGKKAIDDATPSLRRDYSKLGSMNVVTGDDFTMPVYCFVPDGKGWWTLTRGQCLLMIDVRSLKIIGWSLQPERNYNSLVIRTLMNRVCSAFGLPRVWLFERGIWLNSLVVKGAPREWREGKSDTELKPGWERLDVRFIHAKRARSKPAELVGGLLQNLMERMPGYCGRDERRDCPEITKRNKLAVDARRIEPHGLFLSFDAWDAELAKLIATYNAAVRQSADCPRRKLLALARTLRQRTRSHAGRHQVPHWQRDLHLSRRKLVGVARAQSPRVVRSCLPGPPRRHRPQRAQPGFDPPRPPRGFPRVTRQRRPVRSSLSGRVGQGCRTQRLSQGSLPRPQDQIRALVPQESRLAGRLRCRRIIHKPTP
jgi:hypothetical protein